MRRSVLIALSNGHNAIAESVESAEIELRQAESLESSIELARHGNPDVVIVQCDGPDPRVLRFLESIRLVSYNLPIILMGPGAAAIDAPFPDGLAKVIDRWTSPLPSLEFGRQLHVAFATARNSNSSFATSLEDSLSPGGERRERSSEVTQRILWAIWRVGDADGCTMLAGEGGTGKSFFARAIHHHSKRKGSFFVSVDCGLDPVVLDQDLFGGSQHPRLTRFEQARGGTLFLQHLECMPAAVQKRLVSWLQGRATGFSADSPWPDTRIIAAVTGSPESAVDSGLLRQDLLNLLNVCRLDLPPLRDRMEDIPQLVSYFLSKFATESQSNPKSLALVVSHVIARHQWPGNVRELEQVLHCAFRSASTDLIQLGDLPVHFLNDVGPSLLDPAGGRINETASHNRVSGDLQGISQKLFQWARKDAHFQIIPAVERYLVIQAMTETNGNQVQASRLLGITRATLRKRLLRFNIHRDVLIH